MNAKKNANAAHGVSTIAVHGVSMIALLATVAAVAVLAGCATAGSASGSAPRSPSEIATATSGKKAERARFGEIERVENWLSGAGSSAGEATPAGAIEPVSPGEARVIQPLYIHASIAEHHVIAWFDGHDTYEAVEAFVYSKDRIRAILTRHDNSQIDAWYFATGETPEIVSRRDHYDSPISFKMSSNGKDAELSMKTPEGEDLYLSFVGQDKPDPQYGGMTDPGLHSPDGGLPILYREASGTGAKASFVRIGGKRYTIPEDEAISAPPYFIAYTAFLSTGYHSFIFSTFPARQVPIAVPDATVTARERFGSAGIAAIAPAGRDELRFNPPLANLAALVDGASVSSRFAIFFDGRADEEVYGDAIASRSGNLVSLSLRPAYPAWARDARAMRYSIELVGDGAAVSASMER